MKSNITLRQNQTPIVTEALKMKEGIIFAGTGIGKSVIAIELMARLGLTTTIIVKNTVMLGQFIDEIVKFLGVKRSEIGKIGDGSKEIKPITVTTIQSLAADDNLLRLLIGSTSLLICDECQELVTPKRLKIIERFRPTRLYGLTATPFREDARSVNFIFGENTKYAENASMTPTVEVVYSNVNIAVDDYHRIIDNVVANEDRNELIARTVAGEMLKGRKVLVLTKRRLHADILYWKMPQEWQDKKVFLISSKDKGRNTLLSQFKKGEKDFSVIIGTTSLLSVGVDVPSLDTIILGCDIKSRNLTHQSCGRILRIFKGKPSPKIVDVCDNKNPILWRQFLARKRFYKSKKWMVV